MKHNWENYFDISSEYWKKVEKIYEENESFPKKVVKDRNLHHKFPKSFSKKDGAEIDNDEDNLVSLSLADHFRVHYYLWKCAKKGYRGMMARAFTLMRKKAVVYATDETIEQIARDYEEAMKEAAEQHSKAMKGEKNPFYGKKHSEETKKRNAEAHKGKHLSEETKKKLSEANKERYIGEKHPMYGRHHSEESKKKMREAMKGNKYALGYKHSEETKNKMRESHKGKKMSEETKKKLGEAHKGKNIWTRGRHWYNNGKENKYCYECPDGFMPGMLK